MATPIENLQHYGGAYSGYVDPSEMVGGNPDAAYSGYSFPATRYFTGHSQDAWNQHLRETAALVNRTLLSEDDPLHIDTHGAGGYHDLAAQSIARTQDRMSLFPGGLSGGALPWQLITEFGAKYIPEETGIPGANKALYPKDEGFIETALKDYESVKLGLDTVAREQAGPLTQYLTSGEVRPEFIPPVLQMHQGSLTPIIQEAPVGDSPVSQALQGVFPEGAPTSLLEEAQPPRSLPIGTPGWQPNITAHTLVDPTLEAELTYATVDPRQVGLDLFDPSRVTAAQENIVGRLGRGENVAEITQAMTNPELLTEGVRGGAWGKLRDFLISPAQAKNTSIFKSPRVAIPQVEDTTFSDLLKAAQTETGDVAINRLMAKSDPRIPFSLPAGARGPRPEEPAPFILDDQPDPYTSTTALPWDTLGGPVTDQPRTNLDGTITYLTNEEAMASDVAQALANATAWAKPRPRGMPAPSVTGELQALTELAQTDPSIADRYSLGSQALQDITTQVESFSEPRVEWTPPKKKEVKKVKGPTKEERAATRAANQAANKKLLAEKKKDRDIQKAKNAAIRAEKLAARESAKQERERKAAEKALAIQRVHEKMAREEELKRFEKRLRNAAEESRAAYLARKKQEDELREVQGYGWGDMFT